MKVPLPECKLDKAGHSAPVNSVTDINELTITDSLGASRYRYEYPGGQILDALLVNRGAKMLVCTFHGAIHRKKWELPRFEWLSTLRNLGYDLNAMFFSDPTLWMDESIQLGWFAGWPGSNVQRDIAGWITAAANALGCETVMLLGSSGGGFAALQVSALIPGSLCLPFNPTTHIHKYWVNGDPNLHGTERKFIEVAYPHAAPNGIWHIDWEHDWTLAEDDSLSVLRRYSHPLANYVMFASNPNEWHFDQHYLPYLAAVATGDNLQRTRVWEYDGRRLHAPPRPDEFLGGFEAAISWDIPKMNSKWTVAENCD